MSTAEEDPVHEADAYERLGEFHDLFMSEPWEALRPTIRDAFALVPPRGTVLEVGAGSGMGTRVIAEESVASILALEPSLTMRSILTARVADDAELASRVTILADRIPEGLDTITTALDGFVCAHVLGHLPTESRRALFDWLATHMSADAVGVVTHDVGAADAGERSDRPLSRRLGELDYRVEFQAAGDGEYAALYTVSRGSTTLREAAFHGTWEALTADALGAELGAHGLASTVHRPGVLLVRRST